MTERGKTGQGKAGANTIGRTMRMLELLAGEPRGLRITDLANELGLNRAIPHRVLADLIKLGYVAQDPRTERYRVTFKPVSYTHLRAHET